MVFLAAHIEEGQAQAQPCCQVHVTGLAARGARRSEVPLHGAGGSARRRRTRDVRVCAVMVWGEGLPCRSAEVTLGALLGIENKLPLCASLFRGTGSHFLHFPMNVVVNIEPLARVYQMFSKPPRTAQEGTPQRPRESKLNE